MKKAKILLCLLVVLLVGAFVTVAAFAGDAQATDPVDEIRTYNRAELEATVAAAENGKYADTSIYPWALFKTTDGGQTYTFVGAYKVYSLNPDKIQNIDGQPRNKGNLFGDIYYNNNGADMVVLLRSDYTFRTSATAVAATVLSNKEATSDSDNAATGGLGDTDGDGLYEFTGLYDNMNYNACNIAGNIIFDMGGHSLAQAGSQCNLFPVQNKNQNNSTLNVTFIDGSFNNIYKSIFTSHHHGTLSRTDKGSEEKMLSESKNYNFKFVGCSISVAASATEALFSLGGTASDGTYFPQVMNASVEMVASTMNLGFHAADTYVPFVNGSAKGKLTVKATDCTAIMWSTAKFATLKADNGDTETYTNSTIVSEIATDFGTIAPGYASAEEYPLAVFKDGTFLGAYAQWMNGGNGWALLGAINGTSGDITVFLRRNYELSGSTGNVGFHNFGVSAWDSLTLDLNGYTLTNLITTLPINLKHSGKSPQTFTIKNGSMVSPAGIASVGVANTNASKTGISIVLDNLVITGVKETLLSATVTNTTNAVFATTFTVKSNTSIATEPGSSPCLFDLSGFKNACQTANVVIEDGATITSDSKDTTLYKAGAEGLTACTAVPKYSIVTNGVCSTTFTNTAPTAPGGTYFNLATGEFVDAPVADGTVVSYEVNLLDGASIRVNEPTGMRFETVVGEAMFSFLKAAGYNPVVGTLIAPTDLLEGASSPDEVNFLDLVSDLSTATANDEGIYTFYATISEILPQNYTRLFTAVSYLSYTIGEGDPIVVMMDTNNTSRSVYEVACAALKDYSAGTTQYDVVKGFIDSVVTLDADCNVVAPAGVNGYTAPYTVSYEGGVLTITEGGATVTTIVIGDTVYTRGFESVDGVITVNYTAPAAE